MPSESACHLENRETALFDDGTQHRLSPVEVAWNTQFAHEERRAGLRYAVHFDKCAEQHCLRSLRDPVPSFCIC